MQGMGSPAVHSLMSDGVISEQVKKFVFTSRKTKEGVVQHEENLEIYIPELLQASYNLYTWPSAPILAWFLWEHKEELVGKRVLELGSGTALPGILASKCGAIVTLSDSANNPKSLRHIKKSCELNGVFYQVKIIGITWGLFLSTLFTIGPVDLIIGSDCFYDPSTFEDILVTVAYLLEKNPHSRFLCTYQERSADWSIEHLLNKWNLVCTHIPITDLGSQSNINIHELMRDHTIHLLNIEKAN
ncbi:histone-arginine methyltransferase METTL23 isoform X2 [Prorops nasuta]|uniref:histone-arginine methyltransferase METTL23 isoform X2 n=1 Tax=Prorops nasuta TaxID=863751 RepID=UPI0034CFC583